MDFALYQHVILVIFLWDQRQSSDKLNSCELGLWCQVSTCTFVSSAVEWAQKQNKKNLSGRNAKDLSNIHNVNWQVNLNLNLFCWNSIMSSSYSLKYIYNYKCLDICCFSQMFLFLIYVVSIPFIVSLRNLHKQYKIRDNKSDVIIVLTQRMADGSRLK